MPETELMEIENKIEEIEEVLMSLNIRASVKAQLMSKLDDFYEEVETSIEFHPACV